MTSSVAVPAVTGERPRLGVGLRALLGLAAVLVVVTVAVDLRTDPATIERLGGFRSTSGAVVGAAVLAAGAVILRARPGHGTGRVLLGVGALWVVDSCAAAWAQYGVDHPLPATALSFWFVDRIGAFLLVGVPLLLLTYPDGRLPGDRLRVPAVAVLVGSALLPTLLVLVPYEVVTLNDPARAGIPVWDPIRLPIGVQTGQVLLSVARTITLAAPLGAIALLVLRYRSTGADDRVRLRWLLWAGLVAVLVVVLALLFPSGGLTAAALYVAVVLTAGSAAVGVVAPLRWDVDTLVAGTVVHGGLAVAVLLLDLALVAAGGALLGDRLSDRNVTLLALLVAVVVYSPLRAWLWSAAHRRLLGRRVDRYRVVSGLATRLERTADVADQLPALAETVAEAFRADYVQVRVSRSDGSALLATHGVRPDAVTEHPLRYGGEEVGRIVLPDRGLRMLLSARDRRLLLDLIRQAALAIRSADLARELQAGREQLVLAREEDRRRIRNDLHDGLGPTLSGIAMRLDAAGNAVSTDPERAAGLIQAARSDLGTAVAEIRRLVHGLRPPALDDLGLAVAVEHHVEALLASGVDATLAADLPTRLPAAVEVAAYRIVAEALTNVGRHAAATTCSVELTAVGRELRLIITDDGRGIAPDAPAGIGLTSIRDRAAELGGRARVARAPGGGTKIDVVLPIGSTK